MFPNRLAIHPFLIVAFLVGILGFRPLVWARQLTIGGSQTIGYEQNIAVGDRREDDGYAETSLVVGASRPLILWGGRLSFNPQAKLSYLDYFTLDSLDTFTFSLDGPLRLDFFEGGGRPRYLTLSASAQRSVEAVSTSSDRRATKTDVTFAALYSQHVRRSRWKVELGYDYQRSIYDESQYRELERDSHTVSLATLYAFSREFEAGLRGRYVFDVFRVDSDADSQTADVSALARWQVTGRIQAEGEIGYETIAFRGDNESTSGVTLRGGLSWQPTTRWDVAAQLRHQLAVAAEDAGERSRVSEGGLRVAYQFTPKWSGALAPAVTHERHDGQVTEYSLDLDMTYALRGFDLAWQIGVRDRQAGGDDDGYTALHTWVKLGRTF